MVTGIFLKWEQEMSLGIRNERHTYLNCLEIYQRTSPRYAWIQVFLFSYGCLLKKILWILSYSVFRSCRYMCTLSQKCSCENIYSPSHIRSFLTKATPLIRSDFRYTERITYHLNVPLNGSHLSYIRPCFHCRRSFLIKKELLYKYKTNFLFQSMSYRIFILYW
jgi:hypothetical protein